MLLCVAAGHGTKFGESLNTLLAEELFSRRETGASAGRKTAWRPPLEPVKLASKRMKTNPLITFLLGVLIVGAVITFGLAVGYERNFRRLRTLEMQAAQIQNTGIIISSLINDTIEYSKKNPAVTTILERARVPQRLPAQSTVPARTR